MCVCIYCTSLSAKYLEYNDFFFINVNIVGIIIMNIIIIIYFSIVVIVFIHDLYLCYLSLWFKKVHN